MALPARAQKGLEIPSGTTINVRMIDKLSSEENQTGDTFHGTLDEPIEVNGRELYPKGADVIGRVTDVHPTGRLSEPGELDLVLNTVSSGTVAASHPCAAPGDQGRVTLEEQRHQDRRRSSPGCRYWRHRGRRQGRSNRYTGRRRRRNGRGRSHRQETGNRRFGSDSDFRYLHGLEPHSTPRPHRRCSDVNSFGRNAELSGSPRQLCFASTTIPVSSQDVPPPDSAVGRG